MTAHGPLPTRVVSITARDFVSQFGVVDTREALFGYTCRVDTHTLLTLLAYARPSRVLEIGTATGLMTANLTKWTHEDAQVFTMSLVQGMSRLSTHGDEQAHETPSRGDLGRFANYFNEVRKVFFIICDTLDYDFRRLRPLDFVFIDGGHDLETAANDSQKAYDALEIGGWIAWHDFSSTVPWIRVREAIEQLGFLELVTHVEGTQLAFLRKGPDDRRIPRWSPTPAAASFHAK